MHKVNKVMDWCIIEVLMTHMDDIKTASKLACLNKSSPSLPPFLIKEEHKRRDTARRKHRLLNEVRELWRDELDIDLLIDEFGINEVGPQIIDSSITEWCVVHKVNFAEGEILHIDDVLNARDEYTSVLRRTGVWS